MSEVTPGSVNAPVGYTASTFNIIPNPVSISKGEGTFCIEKGTNIYCAQDKPELIEIAQYLTDKLIPATGYDLQVLPAEGVPVKGSITLSTQGADVSLGEEGYEITVNPEGIRITAPEPAGLFWGVQTLCQMLPAVIAQKKTMTSPCMVQCAVIRDYPRYSWRGAMLDVARHFFNVEEVKRYIDLLAYLKINRFHLHLSDDQGWRLMINSWPKLATIGGSTAVDSDPGGYYTQEEYAEIVAYAQKRYMILIPEIDMPGHTNAALAAYAELNCDETAPPLFTGVKVGFSSLCVDKELTYRFIEDILGEIAALTPGPYIHVGGDEAQATKTEEYVRFIDRVQKIVQSCGKKMIGWEEIAQANLLPSSIVQAWNGLAIQHAVEQGAKIILSPAQIAYLDIKYNPETKLGLDWVGYVEVRDSYVWDPETLIMGLSPDSILGVEAPLWTETIRTPEDIEFMAFPRVMGIAEAGWSLQNKRDWEDYRCRLGALGPHLEALKVNFYRSPQVPWE